MWVVFFHTLPMALAAGLGVLPFLFVKRVSERWIGISNAAAAGVMLTASFGLIYEGIDIEGSTLFDHMLVMIGIILGMFFVIWCQHFVDQYDVGFGSLKGSDAKEVFLFVGIMTLHAFAEGLGVGVAFSGSNGMKSGTFITWAIALHNIPEGLAVCLVLIPKGESKLRAALYAIFTSLPQPLVAVPAFYFVDSVRLLQPIGMGASAGTMIWMVFSEMIPEATSRITPDAAGLVVTVAVAAMSTFNVVLMHLE